MPRFTLRQLEAFVAVAEEGTITGAGQILGLSASAIASSVNELERVLGHQLTTRRKSYGVALTPLGAHVLTEARRILGQADALEESLRGTGAELSGRVKIGSYVSLAPSLMVELMAAFRQHHPKVELDFVAGSQDEICTGVLEGQLDLALTYDLLLPPGLQVTPLTSFTPMVIVPQEHRLAGRDQIDLSEIADEPMVVLDISPSRENTALLFRDAGLQPHVAIRTSDFEVTRSLVAKGLGYAIMLQRPAGDLAYGGLPLAVLPLSPEARSLDVALVSNPQLRPQPAAAALRELAVEITRG